MTLLVVHVALALAAHHLPTRETPMNKLTLPRRLTFTDAPRRVNDSTLAYFQNQLEAFDPTLNMPLSEVTWGRDIQLRSGITMIHESSSFTRTTFGTPGTLTADGMPWLNANSTTLPGISVDGEKLVKPIRLLGREISYTSVELERAQAAGLPIDRVKLDALQLAYNLNIDQMVYIGSSDVGAKGLLNNPAVTVTAVANGAGGTPQWTTKTPDEILKDVNALLDASWNATGNTVCPRELRLPPSQYSWICSQKVSSAGNISILQFLEENSIALKTNGTKLNITYCKWLTGIGTGGSDRMVVYTNDQKRVRYPMVPIRAEAAYTLGIKMYRPYIYALGEVEFVFPETALYADGI